jgi:hypothetical protein
MKLPESPLRLVSPDDYKIFRELAFDLLIYGWGKNV